ncbi:MAG: HEAT repeat domain-containing protein [Chloroflexi bacterium]|nr:HEAT repeat domain-containing protein [Chloroflexota bacterium]
MTKPSQKILAYHLARLKDKNPQVRLQSIQELEQLGADEALDALQEVFKTDSNADVRKAAREAGRKIFLKQQNANNS